MDEAVARAMRRWPNVPAVYGWLQLDRRGNWLIKTHDERFEPVVNPTMIEFIGRNYTHDQQGRWYFQNGPQRVFVSLEYTPWVYRLDHTASGFTAHTGLAPETLRRLFLDDSDGMLLETDLGIGVLSDRDLTAVMEQLHALDGNAIEATLLAVAKGNETRVRLSGKEMPIASIRAQEVPERFGFVAHPAPAPGQPDC